MVEKLQGRRKTRVILSERSESKDRQAEKESGPIRPA